MVGPTFPHLDAGGGCRAGRDHRWVSSAAVKATKKDGEDWIKRELSMLPAQLQRTEAWQTPSLSWTRFPQFLKVNHTNKEYASEAEQLQYLKHTHWNAGDLNGNCGSRKKKKKLKQIQDRLGCLTLVNFIATFTSEKEKQANEVPNVLASEFHAWKCSALIIQCCKTLFHWNVKFVFDLADSTAHFSVTAERNKSRQHSDKMYILCPSNRALRRLRVTHHLGNYIRICQTGWHRGRPNN